MAEAEAGYASVLTKTKCADLACLRGLPAAAVEAAASVLPYCKG
eukprot:SAG22_NODE_18_length_32591_cov_38.043549_14_plen_44_part_00